MDNSMEEIINNNATRLLNSANVTKRSRRDRIERSTIIIKIDI